MSFSSEGIRAGRSRVLRAAAAADTAIGHLLGATIAAADFGEVAGAEQTATALASTRDGYARSGHEVHARHLDLERRAQNGASMGDGLVMGTTGIASSVTAGMR